MSFKMAGRLGLPRGDGQGGAGPARAGRRSSRSPCPTDLQGDVMGDLNARRGRVQGTEPAATASRSSPRWCRRPRSLRYAIDLRSLTGGRGRFTAAPRPLRRAAPAPRRQGPPRHRPRGLSPARRPTLGAAADRSLRGVRLRPARPRRRGPARRGPRSRAPLPRTAHPLPARRGARRHRPGPARPGPWSALEYACHARDVLSVFNRRVLLMVAEDRPELGWWDHEAAADDEAYNAQDPAEVADALDRNAAGLRRDPRSGARRRRGRARGCGGPARSSRSSAPGRFVLHEGHHHLLDVGRSLRTARGR